MLYVMINAVMKINYVIKKLIVNLTLSNLIRMYRNLRFVKKWNNKWTLCALIFNFWVKFVIEVLKSKILYHKIGQNIINAILDVLLILIFD